jgi:hypothetical protein
MRPWVLQTAAIIVLGASAYARDPLRTSGASITIVARVSAHAEVSIGDSPFGGGTVQRDGTDRFLITAPANARIDVPFSFVTNTRAAHIRVLAEPPTGLVVDARPSIASCDWVHSPRVVHGSRVVAALSGCRPSQPQAGFITVTTGPEPANIRVAIDPIVN